MSVFGRYALLEVNRCRHLVSIDIFESIEGGASDVILVSCCFRGIGKSIPSPQMFQALFRILLKATNAIRGNDAILELLRVVRVSKLLRDPHDLVKMLLPVFRSFEVFQHCHPPDAVSAEIIRLCFGGPSVFRSLEPPEYPYPHDDASPHMKRDIAHLPKDPHFLWDTRFPVWCTIGSRGLTFLLRVLPEKAVRLLVTIRERPAKERGILSSIWRDDCSATGWLGNRKPANLVESRIWHAVDALSPAHLALGVESVFVASLLQNCRPFFPMLEKILEKLNVLEVVLLSAREFVSSIFFRIGTRPQRI